MTKIFDENVWITLSILGVKVIRRLVLGVKRGRKLLHIRTQRQARIIENDRRKDPRTSKANTKRTKHTLPNHWNPKTTHKKLNPRNTLVRA
jgi:hypothetical protein